MICKDVDKEKGNQKIRKITSLPQSLRKKNKTSVRKSSIFLCATTSASSDPLSPLQLQHVVGLVTRVYSMTEVVVNGETENQFNFEIMDERYVEIRSTAISEDLRHFGPGIVIRGKEFLIRCILRGDAAVTNEGDLLETTKDGSTTFIVLQCVQFSRIIERGVELDNFLGATRLYVNPDFPEVSDAKRRVLNI
ncbi:hypothetical protein K1719_034116 [Acacia pycnantha]|nr:hypothetical protein K1719_034116 [Acacia pycnantha]